MNWQTRRVGNTHLRIAQIAAVYLMLLMSSTGMAQLPTATILGVVKDSSGAVIPEANLTARNVETGQARTAISGGDGSFRFSALPVGQYEVRVEHPGFQSAIRRGMTVTVGQDAVVNFTLEVGAIEQTVAVTAEAPLVNTTSGSLGGLVDEQKVADLPLNGRNYVDLMLLQPGVQQDRSGGTRGSAGVAQAGSYISSNGAPPRSNNYLLDGAMMQGGNDTSSASVTQATLGVEGIREFRVITNSFSAEYGMRMGSQMIIVSKGGTNDFHGSLYEYLRNSALDARNFFDRITATTPRRLPAFTRNQFGGSLGGPIRRDKTFFFVVYEALRDRLGQTIITNTIPSAAKMDGGLVQRISPAIKPFLQYFPDPNLPNNLFTYPGGQPSNEHYGQIRIDQTFSENDSLFGRFTINDGINVVPGAFPIFPAPRLSRNLFATLSETHIFSPALLNTFRLSFSRPKYVGDISLPSALNGPPFSFVPGLPTGNINITGISTWGPPNTSPSSSRPQVFTLSDDLFSTRGRHSLKVGTLINRNRLWQNVGTNWRGVIRFTNLQNFLLGQSSTYTAGTPGSIVDRTYAYSTFGFYGQDDVRVTPTFTLNLGLRYEFHNDYTEVHNMGAALRDMRRDASTTIGPPFENPSLRNFSPRFGFAWDVTGNGKTAVRGGFGLLYDVATFGSSLRVTSAATPPFSSQSVVNNPPPITVFPLLFPPGTQGNTLRVPDYHMQQPHMLQYNLTLERQLPFGTGLSLAYAGSRGINLVLLKEGNPTVPLGLPQDGRCVAVSLPPAFTASGPKCWLGTEQRMNPNWSSIEIATGASSSWYNSLQLGLNKRLGRGLQFQSSYTWSKLIDETQAQIAEGDLDPADPSDRKVDRGRARFDIRHNFRFNTIYRLPELASSRGLARQLLGGWWVSGILSAQSGYGFNPTETANRSRSQDNLTGATTDRPDLVLGRHSGDIISGTTAGCPGVAAGQKLGGPDLYFDPCAFTLQPAGFLGTAGRNTLSGPGIATLDFSIVKDTILRFLGEAGKLEFRAEFFNLLNRANFALPSSAVFAGNPTSSTENRVSTAGQISGTITTSRQIQFALKILF